MVVAWMVYAGVIGGVFAGAAALMERGVGTAGGALRWVWVAALVGALAVPLAGVTTPWLPSGEAVATPERGPTPSSPLPLPGLVVSPVPAPAVATLERWEPWVLRAWGATSLVLAGLLLASAHGLRRSRAVWRLEVVDGEPVWISSDMGPAVVGLLRPAIVIPEWVARMAPRRRQMVLAHEREHRRAGDTWLLAGALVAAILVPWNAALWWMVGRLRTAVEIDCDARVVGTATPGLRRAYGALLLDVGRRLSSGRGARPSPAFAETPSSLPRRIRRLAERGRPGRGATTRWTRAVPGSVAGLVLVGVACSVPGPIEAPAGDEAGPATIEQTRVDDLPAPPDEAQGRLSDRPVFTPYTVAPRITNRREVTEALKDAYPPLLRDAGIGGSVSVYFFVDAEGRVQDTRINQGSGHAQLDAAALEVARVMQFSPALNRDERVPVWVSFPITFTES
jgi:TonB family protein